MCLLTVHATSNEIQLLIAKIVENIQSWENRDDSAKRNKNRRDINRRSASLYINSNNTVSVKNICRDTFCLLIVSLFAYFLALPSLYSSYKEPSSQMC